MQTLFDLVKVDFIIHSMIFNIFSLGSVAMSNLFNKLDETFARVITLTLFSLVLSNTIYFIGACLIQLASIYLSRIIEDVKGKKTKYILWFVLYIKNALSLKHDVTSIVETKLLIT
jgi:hypothetical protein